MGREERDPQDARTTRSSRRDTQPTDRLGADDVSAYGEPVNPDWRGSRSTRRGRRSQALPSSRQEFVLWLQYGGWRVLAAAAVLVVALIGLIYITRLPAEATSPFSRPTESVLAGGGIRGVPTLPTITPAVISPTLATAPASGSNGGGAQFRVIDTGTEGLLLRPNHSTDGDPMKTLQEGSIVTVIGPDFSGPDYVWKNVRDAEGSEGWVAAKWLQAVP